MARIPGRDLTPGRDQVRAVSRNRTRTKAPSSALTAGERARRAPVRATTQRLQPQWGTTQGPEETTGAPNAAGRSSPLDVWELGTS
jgi:hypothetical protein